MTQLIDTLTWPLIGGALIGLAAAALMLFNGRIAGISGILGGALGPGDDDGSWRWFFLGGLVIGGALIYAQLGEAAFAVDVEIPLALTALGGLLVGFGTRLGSGCTAGHGICGLARLSPRSLVSVVTFIGSGALVTFLVRHVGGL